MRQVTQSDKLKWQTMTPDALEGHRGVQKGDKKEQENLGDDILWAGEA